MKRNTRKGFTGIELVIVIAIIAILAASLIPSFGGLLQGSKKTADTQLIRNLNTALLSDPTGVDTMSEALALAEEWGFDVATINAKALNNEILWDEENNVFCYLNDGKIEYSIEEHEELTNKLNYWVISDEIHDTYSTYYVGTLSEVNTARGFDAGKSNVSTVNYVNYGTAQEVTIRTNGGTLNIDAPADTVNHYGYADKVGITKVADASFHAFGRIALVEITEGRFVAETGSEVNAVVKNADDSKVVVDGSVGLVIMQDEIKMAHDAAELNELLTSGAKYIKFANDITSPATVVLTGDVVLDGNGYTLTVQVSGEKGRAINVDSDGKVVIANLTVVAGEGTERAINIIQKPVNLTINNVKAAGFKYTVNVAKSSVGSTIIINGGEISGWAAVNMTGDKTTFIANNATLIGENTYGNNEVNSFAVIAMGTTDVETLEDITVIVNGGKVVSITKDDAAQYIIGCYIGTKLINETVVLNTTQECYGSMAEYYDGTVAAN